MVLDTAVVLDDGIDVVDVVDTTEVVLFNSDVVVVPGGTEVVVVVDCTVVVVVGGTVVLVVCILKVARTFSSCTGLDKSVVISILHSPDITPFWIVNGTNMSLPTLNNFRRLLRLTP